MLTDTDETPQWARDEAMSRTGHTEMLCPALHELAAMIARHEEPPVDPLLVEAREIAASKPGRGSSSVSRCIRNGLDDWHPDVRLALVALKRGVELARQSDSPDGPPLPSAPPPHTMAA